MAVLHGLGLLCTLSYALLAWLNRPGGHLSLGEYFPLLALCWLALGGAVWKLRDARASRGCIPVVLWALVFRLIGLMAEPIMEDDYYRYLWDGRQFAMTGNPYATSPRDHFDEATLDPKFEAILSRINYPHLPTIYGPVLQYLFVTAHAISPGELWPLKLLLLLADIAVGCLIFRCGGVRALLIYSWCPLLIQETAFTSHPDLLGVLFMVASWRCQQAGQSIRSALLIGLSIGTKVTAGVIAPFLLKGQRPKHWMITGLTIVAVYLPFWLQGSWGDWTSLWVFAREWEFNSGGFAVLSWMLGKDLAAPAALAVTLGPLAWLWWRTDAPSAVRGDWVYGWFFFWSAVVQPWYLLWLLPWVAIFPTCAGITSLAVVSISYTTSLQLGLATGDLFAHPVWVRPVEYGLIALALAACRTYPPRT